MSDLVADAEDLLARLGDSSDPQIKALRSKVEDSITEIRRQARIQLQKRGPAGSGPGWKATAALQQNPVVAAALGTALGVGLLFLLTRMRFRD